MENNRLGLDDTFKFKCRECGRCCKNREDILLTTRDLYNIAKYFGRSMGDIVKRYCDVYIGVTSRIPIVKLKSVGPDNACPLLLNKHCIVHRSKPVVCALFPLGRGVTTPEGDTTFDYIQPQYFLQKTKCGINQAGDPVTVRNWLSSFDIPIEDKFYSDWTLLIMYLGDYFRSLEEQKLSKDLIARLRDVTFILLYIEYDINLDFMPQFKDKMALLRDIFDRAKDKMAVLDSLLLQKSS